MINWAALANEVVEVERQLSADERRSFQRVDLQTPTRVRMVTDRSGSRSPALVKDLSVTGVGLVAGFELMAGQFVVMEFQWRGRAQLILARVVHCRRVDEGLFRVGAEFFEEMPIKCENPPVPEAWMERLPLAA